MKGEQISRFLINKDASIKEAMKVIDRGELGIVFVVDEHQALFGAVTDGDIRRAILQGMDIKKPIKGIANKNTITLPGGFTQKELANFKVREDIVKKIPIMGALKVPVINQGGNIEDIIFISAHAGKKQGIRRSVVRPVKKVLVTGGAGYLGSILCKKLLESGYRVRVLDNANYGEHGIAQLAKNKSFEFLI